MVGGTRFSHDATSRERKKLWDPLETLGIINTDPGYQCITCIGYAPSQRRRCRNPIRADNRKFIMNTLNDISYLPPESPAVMSRLREIVGPILCVRYHQNQAETVVRQWQGKLQLLKPQIENRRPTKPVKSSKRQESMHDIKDMMEQLCVMKELLTKLQEDDNNERHEYQGHERRSEQVAKDRQEEERKRRKSVERDNKARLQEKERLEKERMEKERLERERLEKERLEKERQEKERLETERREREEKIRREREQAAYNERSRQKAQKAREQREQEKRKKNQKEREEWDQLWTKYQERWAHFRASISIEGSIRDTMPWPVKSGLYRDVIAGNVKEFFQKAVPRDANMASLMRKECQKWHSDKTYRLPRGCQLTEVEQMVLEMISRVVTDLLNNSARKSAEFLD